MIMNYKYMTAKEIAVELGRTTQAIHKKAERLGLNKNKTYK